MFDPEAILYEDNHLLVVNKQAGQLVQPDPSGDTALEEEIKAYLKVRDQKPGNVFLGVVHRIDRPVSGAVLFAKTGKALVRMNEEVKNREIKKIYWALTEATPVPEQGELHHYILRDGRTNRSRALDAPKGDAKEARLRYETRGRGRNYIFQAPYAMIFPGLAITVTVLAFNLLGDGIRDAFDPKSRNR